MNLTQLLNSTTPLDSSTLDSLERAEDFQHLIMIGNCLSKLSLIYLKLEITLIWNRLVTGTLPLT